MTFLNVGVNPSVRRAACLVAAVVLASLSILIPLSNEVSAYTPHAPISIVGNAQFTPANGVTGGSGTWDDPYVIEDWEINASTSHGVKVFSTDAHFVIRSVYIHSGSIATYPMFLVDVENCTIENTTVSNSNWGVNVGSSANIIVKENRLLSNSEYGLYVISSRNVTVEANEFLDKGIDIQIESSSEVTLKKNNVWSQSTGIAVLSSSYITVEDNNVANHSIGIDFRDVDYGMVIGNRVSNNGDGIIIERGVNDNLVTKNEVHNNSIGIRVLLALATVTNNNVSQNGNDGISVSFSANATITNNNVSSNGGYGVGIIASTNATVIGNVFASDGVFVVGNSLKEYNSHTITPDNRVNGKPLYYYKDCRDLDVGGVPMGQLIVANCTNVAASNLRVEDTDVGIEMAFVNESTVAANVISDSMMGIYYRYSANFTITGNTISRIDREGIYLDKDNDGLVERSNVTSAGTEGIHVGSSVNVTLNDNSVRSSQVWAIRIMYSSLVVLNRNDISGGVRGLYFESPNNVTMMNNTITNTWNGTYSVDSVTLRVAGNRIESNVCYGIYLKNSILASVYNNSIVNNGIQAYDDKSVENRWDDGYPNGGNYWSDYAGLDQFNGPSQNLSGSDGIGDTPYVIDLDSRDRYPLMKPLVVLLPDLNVSSSDIAFSQPPPLKQGLPVFIDGTIWNTGTASSGPTVARFYDAGPPSMQIGGDQSLAPIPPGSSADVLVEWTPTTPGSHDICVVADPIGSVQEENETNNIACKSVEVVFSRQFTRGHLLISFPLIVADESIESVLSSMSGCYDYVRWYDSADTMSHWKSYSPARTHNSLLRLDRTMGYWINVTSTCSFAPVGTPPSSTTVNLKQGWNMVGFPSFNTTYTIADLKADLGLAGVLVEAYDSGVAPYYLQRVSDSLVMKSGEGYWIYVPSDASWLVKG